ncbi:MAG TPA: heme o synthase [Methylomirabilota bacterium]|nr:heme o synthase [Methylomirabilota bacterium]
MKAAAEAIPTDALEERSLFAILMDLIKARLTALVLLTTLVGYYMGAEGPIDFLKMLQAMLATGLVASGASALNQFLEREHDAKMRRTENRPLPSGKMQPDTVLIFGGLTSAFGLLWLAVAVNPLTSLLGAVTLVTYVFVYTPLKRVTALNTAIGAIPGAIPPLMGWTAATGEISAGGWALFAILFFWQLPHFLAIAWMYKEEYMKAGYVMLPNSDETGARTARQALSHTLGLVPISLCPAVFGQGGVIYFIGALALGVFFVWRAIQFARNSDLTHARQLFFASIIYLPLLLSLLVIDKVR